MLPSGMLKMLLYFRHTQQHRCVQVWDRTHFYSKPDTVLIRQNPFLFKTGRSPLFSELAQHNSKGTSTQIYMNRRRPRVRSQQTMELISAGKTSWSSERNGQCDWNKLRLPNLVISLSLVPHARVIRRLQNSYLCIFIFGLGNSIALPTV